MNNLTKELVTRSGQLSFFKYIGILPNPDKLLARTGNTIAAYRDLKNDPHLWSCIQSRKSGVVSHKFTLKQGNASDLVYGFVQRCLASIDIPQLVKQMCEAVLFGFQPFEIIWQPVIYQRRHLFQIKSIQQRPQEYFVYDTNGKLRLLDRSKPNGRELPDYKIINIQHEADYTNPYGQALLSKCYWSVTFKNSAIRFWVNFLEKFDLPTIIATPTNDAVIPDDDKENLLNGLIDMMEQNAILTTGNIDVQLHDNNKTGNVELYKELINMCNAEISKVILSQTLTTEIGIGSYAAAKTHQEIRNDVVTSDIELATKGLNNIVEYICHLNFGKCEMPMYYYNLNEEEETKR